MGKKCLLIIFASLMALTNIKLSIAAMTDPDKTDSIIVGNLDLTHYICTIGDTIEIPVWVKCDENVTGLGIPIAIERKYISSMTEGALYNILAPYAIKHWEHAEFVGPYSKTPKENYDTYALVGKSIETGGSDSLALNTGYEWRKIAEFAFVVKSDSSLITQITRIIPGSYNGKSEAVFFDKYGNTWLPILKTLSINIVPKGYLPIALPSYNTSLRNRPRTSPDNKYADVNNLLLSLDPVERALEYAEIEKDKYCLTEPRSELKLREVREFDSGIAVEFDQVAKGIIVDAAYFQVEFTIDKRFNGARANIIPEAENVDTSSLISKEQAIEIINEYLRRRDSSIKVIRRSTLTVRQYDNEFRAAWVFIFGESKPLKNTSGPIMWLIDARTGEPWMIDSEYVDTTKADTFGGYDAVKASYEYAQLHKKQLGLTDPRKELKPWRIPPSCRGTVSFEIFWKGIRVHRQEMRFRYDRFEGITSVHGSIDNQLKAIDIVPEITEETAESTAIDDYRKDQQVSKEIRKPATSNTELVFLKHDGSYYLAWYMVIDYVMYYFVDAHQRDVLLKYPAIIHDF